MQNWSLIYRALPKHLNSGSLENKKKEYPKKHFRRVNNFLIKIKLHFLIELKVQ